MGRTKEYPNRIVLPLSEQMMADIEEARLDGEDRLTMIRKAIEREIEARLITKSDNPNKRKQAQKA